MIGGPTAGRTLARLLILAVAATLVSGCKARKPPTRQPGPPAQARPHERAGVPAAASRPSAAAPGQLSPGTWSSAPAPPPMKDRGIFPGLSAGVRLRLPSWLRGGPVFALRGSAPGARFLLAAGVPVGFAPAGVAPAVTMSGGLPDDADSDGVPDALDLLIGAKKAVLNNAAYTEGYRRLKYPGGDVPRGVGVCTDVVIRALRNAGLDLQRLVHEDIRRARKAYGRRVRRPDSNIDHRRVRTILPYFKRHWTRLAPDRAGRGSPLLPGDLVFLNTMGDHRPDHIGIISDRLGPSGYPLVINNWTVGHRTSEMDLLRFVPITHRFRLPVRRRTVEEPHRGLAGLLARRGIQLGAGHRQVLLVTSPLWTTTGGRLQRLVRDSAGIWRPVGRSLTVSLGSTGLGWGRGLHASRTREGPVKQEGDRRSPAGVFRLGPAFGPNTRPPYAGSWPWRRADSRDRWVDDPGSRHYNTWQRLTGAAPAWRSAEDLSQYRLALVIEHNTRPVSAGAGSAIFLHTTPDTKAPSVGCTMLRHRDLVQVLRWLDPAARPVLVQVPGVVL